ncbi:5'/3'-nucleotidase SurE [Halobacteriales archaeon QS_1_68_20]|nr:MAG: 5'/3'-nucleotidase SurE [Halobacteriales archaeon QS_1_68_20]
MTDEPSILLTNDDGIDATGIRVLAEALSVLGDVTVVAPTEDKSGVGRKRSWEGVAIEEHDLGYAVDGTPVDAVVAGVVALDREFDVVVSGCNSGPNVGTHVLGRSGTVGAAIEAGFLGLPAIAVSMYDRDELLPEEPLPSDFEVAAEATQFLLPRLDEGPFADADYLNVNAPADVEGPPMRLTRPSTAYALGGRIEDGRVELHDTFWRELSAGDVPDGVDTDRRACVDGEVSVSPLSVPRADVVHAGQVVEEFDARP